MYQDGSLPHANCGISCCFLSQYSFWYALLFGERLCVSQLPLCYCTKFVQIALDLVQKTLILKQLSHLNEVVWLSSIYFPFTQLALYRGRREVYSPQIKILPMKVVPYPIYTLFKDLKAGMVGMELQDEMVEMGPQDYQERGVSLASRDHLGYQVCTVKVQPRVVTSR